MVAKINGGRDSSRLRYNERKVERQQAELIYAGNFFAQTADLTYPEKLRRFRFLNEQRPDVRKKMLHITLNFHEGETLQIDQLKAIATQYMQGIGLARQPYLVYRHDDLDRPHLHIVTNIIEPGGNRIPTHNIGKDKSEPTRKAIEKEFGLLPAEKSPHRIKINRTIEQIWQHYRFTSFEQYNALLRPHRLLADPGKPGSATHEHHGLLYRTLDAKGHPTGRPIKASALSIRPTLTRLEEKFARDRSTNDTDKTRLLDKLDWAYRQSLTRADFTTQLKKEGVEVRTSRNTTFYIDHPAGAVITDTDLGPQFHYPTLLRSFGRQHNQGRSRQHDQEPDAD